MSNTNFTFTLVDPSNPKKKKWIHCAPSQQKHQFRPEDKTYEYTIQEKKPLSPHQLVIKEINTRLKNTKWTYQKLEKKFSDKTQFYVVYDMKANSTWYNTSFMEVMKKNDLEYLSINLFDILEIWNKDHPVLEVMKNIFKNQPETLQIDTSPVNSSTGVTMAIKAHFERIEGKYEPYGYLVRFTRLNQPDQKEVENTFYDIQFTQEYEIKKTPISERDKIIKKINKKLKKTKLTFENLEAKYSNETRSHILYDLKGNSIWFNASMMEHYKRTYKEYLTVNLFDILIQYNPQNPIVFLLIDFFESQEKIYEFESEINSSIGLIMTIKATLDRVDDNDGCPFGYLLHFDITNEKKNELCDIDTDKFFK
eukprot:gene8059-12521_t